MLQLNKNLIKVSINCFVFILISLSCVNTYASNTEKFLLSDFYYGNPILKLNGINPSNQLSIPLSPRVKVTSAKLTLKVTSSIALIDRLSILNIRFNNTIIGQVAFDAKQPELTADVIIPTSLWHAEYNQLTFSASQHSSTCQDPNAPELWSELNLKDSYLTLQTDSAINRLNLHKLSSFFHPGIGGQQQAKIFTVKDDSNLALIEQDVLPIVVQGLSLRANYRPINFDYQGLDFTNVESSEVNRTNSTQLIENYNRSSWYLNKLKTEDLHILVGTKETLKNALSEQTINNIKGPFLKVEKTPEIKIGNTILVPSQDRLIISGITADDLMQAAATLAYMDDRLNPDNAINIISQSSTSDHPVQTNITLHPGETYTFDQLGADSSIFTGIGMFSKYVQIRLPADYYVSEHARVKVIIDFSYGAGFGPGSILNTIVNGQVITGLILDDEEGDFYNDYTFSIPAKFFKGGMNTLEFSVSQKTELAGAECLNINGNYLRSQIDSSSKITLPESAHLAIQPDLNLLGKTGYPFAQFTQDQDANIYITQPEMRSAALTLSGKLAQSSGGLLPKLHIVSELPEKLSPNSIILATPEELSEPLFRNVSTSITNSKKWPYQLQNYLYNNISDTIVDNSNNYKNDKKVTIQNSSLGQLSVLVASKNPYAQETGTLFIITAQSSDLITERVEQLVQSTLWTQLSGDFFVWQDAKKPLIKMNVSTPYQMGDASSLIGVSAWLSNNPWYWVIAILLIVLLFSLLSYILLKRRHKKLKGEW